MGNCKWRFLFVDEDGSVTASNDEALAGEIANWDTWLVVDLASSTIRFHDGDADIKERVKDWE